MTKHNIIFQLIAFGIILTLIGFGCKSKELPKVQKTGVNFVPASSLGEIMNIAERENKLVFVDFYTDWCLPCKMMDSEVYSDKNVETLFDQHFISYKVNAEKNNGPNLSFLYEVKEYPTLVFLDLNGRVLKRAQGAMSISELMKMVDNLMTEQISKTSN